MTTRMASIEVQARRSSSLQVDQGAEHLICRLHDLRRQTDLMPAGHLFDGIGGKCFRIDSRSVNAATGNADPLHAGLDALKAHGKRGGYGHGSIFEEKSKNKQTVSQ